MSASPLARLALGTVQFGVPYGYVAPSVPPGHDAVSAILGIAWRGGIDLLDTAAAYGSAELVIGQARPAGARFAIVSKAAPVGAASIDEAAVARFRDGIRDSLERLRVDTLDALLVHHAPDLLAPGGSKLFAALESLRGEGVIRRIGVSVYDAATLKNVLADYPIEVVQVPLNVLDQRLLRDGSLGALAARGVEVHARSVFLQGVLLMSPEQLPARFANILPQLRRFRSAAAAAGLSPAAAALGFAARCPGVTRLVIGVNNAGQLRDDLAAFHDAASPHGAFDASPFAIEDRDIIDPRSWAA